MTTRSNASGSTVSREDSDVYAYALRVAVLSHAIYTSTTGTSSLAPSAPSTSATPGGGGGASSSSSSTTVNASALKRPTMGAPTKSHLSSSTSSFRPTDGWTNALFSFGSSSDGRGGRGTDGSVKFPKDLIKALETRLMRISAGQDVQHSDPQFRASVKSYLVPFTDKNMQLQLSKQRQIEQVILMFVTSATKVLKVERPDDWKSHLNVQVGEFVAVVRDALKSFKGVSPELLQRLESYCATLVPPEPSSSSSRLHPTNTPASPSTSKLTLDQGPPPSIPGMATNVQEMPLVQAVGRLFNKPEHELTKDVVAIRRMCTEQAAFRDLKACINNVAQGAPFPARREDFDSDDAFAAWRKQESDELQELLLEMIKRNPSLVNSAAPSEVVQATPSITTASSNGSVSNRSSLGGPSRLGSPAPTTVDGDSLHTSSDQHPSDPHDITSTFIFVPPDPKFYYKRLFEIALDYDYDAMKDLPPDQDVSLTILSPVNEELMRDCATRWRVMAPLRTGTFLALIGQHYKHQGVPEACVAEALSGVERVAHVWSYWRWPWADRQYLFKALSTLFDNLLSRFFEIFQGIIDLPFEDVVDLLEIIYSNEIFREDVRDISTTLQELQQGMRKFVAMAYEEKQIEVDSMDRPHDLAPFLFMLEWIMAETKGYNRQFPAKVLETIDVPAIFLGIAGPWFVQHLDASREALYASASQSDGAAGDHDLLALYRQTIKLQDVHNEFCPETPLVIDFSAWFEPYVRRWLATTATKTEKWVKEAIRQDRFEGEGADGHSSSIVDLIDSCKSATDFITQLNWPNEYEEAKYMTSLSQTIAKCIEGYSNTLEEMFVDEMFPHDPQETADQDVARPSAWLTKAKLAVQGDKKVEPFVFSPESCVKLNNIQAARVLLSTMSDTMQADKVSRIVELNTPPVPADQAQPSRFLFTLKMVLGENLTPPDNSSRTKKLDPFLIVSDPQAYRVAKTRTLYQTNDPRWDETVDVSVQGDLWLRATVYHRNLVDHHDNVGCTYIHLDPNKFNDFLPRDLWYQLQDVNKKKLDSRLLLRISMEGEKDDIQFYFGRAFRSLKRAESDMVRIMVDKMMPFVHHYISQSTLKALVKTSYNFDIDIDLAKVRGDLSKSVGKLNVYVRDAISGPSHVIPPVREYGEQHEQNPSPSVPDKVKKGRGPLTDLEIEDAIGDLFDYFNTTFETLKHNLSQEAWSLVSSRLWKGILTQIEGLIVPPLSDRPTEMHLLSEREVDIVFKWLGFLVNFFHGQGEGVPLEDLRNAKYRELVEARMYYDWSPDQLMEESVRSMQRQMLSKSNSVLGRSKSVYQQRNLGTIRARKIEKKQMTTTTGEMILRILRMHPNTSDFISGQLSTLSKLQAEQAERSAQQLSRGAAGSLQRRVNGGGAGQRNGVGGGRASVTRGRGTPGLGGVPALPSISDVQ